MEYADDIATFIVARDLETAQIKVNQVIRSVRRWMENHPSTYVCFVLKKGLSTVPIQMVHISKTYTIKYLTPDILSVFWRCSFPKYIKV